MKQPGSNIGIDDVKTYGQTHMQAVRHTERPTDRQTDIQTGMPTDRQAGRQTRHAGGRCVERS